MTYWLMKSEPDTYSIDDLEKNGKGMWEGCRNYTVRNYIRDEMKIGDQAFFYHSSCPVPGIVGTMEVVSEAYPDPTQFDPDSEYYDPKSKRENPRWFVVDVAFKEKFADVVPLSKMRENASLRDMVTLRRGNRLSITTVEPNEWEAVLKMADR